jgi:hypothetical protein
MKAANVDGNQKVIVQALRDAGVSVTLLHRVGDGCPDLLCGFRRVTTILELKTEDGELEPSQERWFREWRGGPAHVARSIEESFAAVGVKIARLR